MLIKEPVRLYMYGILVPLAGVLVFYGLLTEQSAPLWIALLNAVIGVPAIETARSLVSPVDPDSGRHATR